MRPEESGFPQRRLKFGSSVISLGSVCLETYIREGWASAVIMASNFSFVLKYDLRLALSSSQIRVKTQDIPRDALP